MNQPLFAALFDETERGPLTVSALTSAVRSALEARFYYDAASFYYAHDKDIAQALKWITRATEMKPTLYSFFYKQAQIEAKLGRKAEAIAAAEKSIELLKAAKEPDEPAIRNSQMLIDRLR